MINGSSPSLLEAVSAVLSWLPAESARVEAFSLTSEREFFRSPAFSRDSFDNLATALQSAPTAPIDAHVLQTYPTPATFLAKLINRELGDPAPADLVIFLGHPQNSGPPAALDTPPGANQKFVYLQFENPPQVPLFMGERPATCSSGAKLIPSPQGMVEDTRACHTRDPVTHPRRRMP